MLIRPGTPIPAIPGQEHPDDARTELRGRRPKEWIDGRARQVLARPPAQVGAAVLKDQVLITRRHVGHAPLEEIPARGLDHLDRGVPAEDERQPGFDVRGAMEHEKRHQLFVRADGRPHDRRIEQEPCA